MSAGRECKHFEVVILVLWPSQDHLCFLDCVSGELWFHERQPAQSVQVEQRLQVTTAGCSSHSHGMILTLEDTSWHYLLQRQADDEGEVVQHEDSLDGDDSGEGLLLHGIHASFPSRIAFSPNFLCLFFLLSALFLFFSLSLLCPFVALCHFSVPRRRPLQGSENGHTAEGVYDQNREEHHAHRGAGLLDKHNWSQQDVNAPRGAQTPPPVVAGFEPGREVEESKLICSLKLEGLVYQVSCAHLPLSVGKDRGR